MHSLSIVLLLCVWVQAEDTVDAVSTSMQYGMEEDNTITGA